MGRPSKLTPATHRIVVEALATGCYRETAAEYAGIGVSTFYRWMEQGEADIEHDRQSPYRELLEAIKLAESHAEVEALELIRSAAKKTWTAAAWLLERKKPDQWGRRVKVDTGAEHGQRIAAVIQGVLTDLDIDLDDDEVRDKISEHLNAIASR